MKNPLGSRAKLILKIAVSVCLLAVVLRKLDFHALRTAILEARPAWFLAAFALFMAGQALSSVKWRVLSLPVGLKESPGRFLAYYFVGMFFNTFGLGTVGGDVVRSLYLSAPSGRKAVALNTVVADRVSGLIVLSAIGAAALLLFRTYDLPWWLYWTALCLTGGLSVGWWAAPRIVRRLFRPGHAIRKLVVEDLAPYWENPALLLRAALLSAVFHVSQIVTAILLAESLGERIDASYYFIFVPLVNILSSLPLSLNGLGVREAAYYYFLTHPTIHLQGEAAVAFGLLWLLLVLLSGVAGGFVFLAMGARTPASPPAPPAADPPPGVAGD